MIGTVCRPLGELRAADERSFGGKSTGLGELLAAGIPVPPGFGVSTAAFRSFIEAAGVDAARILAAVDPGDVAAVQDASRRIGEAMRGAELPSEVSRAINAGYERLGEGEVEPPPVAVRSSAVGEDARDATFAGQQETYLWVRGADDVLSAVRDCWASLYSAPAISYRARLGGAAAEPAMGITVQRMVDAEISGVLFTCNPVSGDPSMVAVNASWGLGLAVVGGEVTPDDYLVSKVTGEVVRARVQDKAVQYVSRPDGRGAHSVEVPAERRSQRCLDDDALRGLVELARRVERHFGCHQDVEWAIARETGEVFVVQSRPVTTLRANKPAEPPPSALELVMRQFGAKR